MVPWSVTNMLVYKLMVIQLNVNIELTLFDSIHSVYHIFLFSCFYVFP